jgi:tRNA threonylcarbamoyl adenosine modification protein YeaZ
MAILAIDTSTKFAELAIKSGDNITTITAKSPNSHIEKLAELFRELLAKVKLETSSIDKIILGKGPGSFTGLRIGYAFASGLASGLRIPIQEVCSFAAVATVSHSKMVIVLADAGRNEFFAGVYLDGQSYMDPNIIQPSELLVLLSKLILEQDLVQQEVVVLSNLQLDPNLSKYQQFSLENIAEALLSYEISKLKDFSSLDLAMLQPNYLRPVAALKISERT